MNSEFRIERKFSPTPAKKSASESFKESIFYFFIIIGVYYLILGIWKVLTAPLRALFLSDRAKLDRRIKIAVEKKNLRDRILFHSREGCCDNNDVYVLRPVFGRDENELDSRLMYVPTIYYKDALNRSYITAEFLDYLQNQVDLHINAPAASRHTFLWTIRRLYPEFTPKFSVIESEISDLKEKAEAVRLTNELIAEMVKAGVRENKVKDIIERNENDPERLSKELLFAKKHPEALSNEIKFFTETGCDPNSIKGKQASEALFYGEDVAMAILNGQLSYPKYQELAKAGRLGKL